MAETESDLRNKISVLESHIRALESELYRSSQQMGDMLNKQTQTIRNQTAEQLDRDYREAFSSAMKKLDSSYTKEIEKLRTKSVEAEKRIKDMEVEVENERAKLYKQLSKLQGSDKAKRSQAEYSFTTLQSEIETARQTDTECFYPRKIQIYYDAANQIADLMRKELYSEAFSISESAILGVKRLKNDTERKSKLFDSYFRRYEAIYNAARNLVRSKVAHTMTDEDGEIIYELSTYGLDYWSDGLYYQFLKILMEHGRVIDHIKSEGLGWIIAHGENDPIRYIKEQSDHIMNLPNCLKVSISYAFSMLDNYEHSLELKKLAGSVLKTQGFLYDYTAYGDTKCGLDSTPGYKKYYENYLCHERCIEENGKADFREEKRLVFKKTLSNDKTEYVYIRIIPVRNRETVGYRSELIVTTEEERTGLANCLESLLHKKGIGDLITVNEIVPDIDSIGRSMQIEEVIEIAATQNDIY